MERVYLDANATTQPLPEVREAIAAALADDWGNPSSPHGTGRRAAAALAAARSDVAGWLGARTDEVVFTSGGTEADRLGILGVLEASGGRGHVVASSVEHPAVRDLLRQLAGRQDAGVEVDWLRPASDGRVDPAAVEGALRADTALVCLMWANNETGVLQPVEEAATLCRDRGVPLLVDAVQAAGKLPVDFGALGADLLAVSAHKLHGPKGVGALLVRHGARWKPPFPASQERSRRSGTEAVGVVAGFAAACRAARDVAPEVFERMAALRDRMERTIAGALGDVEVNGTGPRTPNTTNLLFRGVESDRLLALLDRAGVDASNGSACSSGTPDPSHVLLAQGRSRREALSSVRYSLSRFTTDADVERAMAATIESVEIVRARP
jgi:cysteine desulfurase